MAHGEMKSEASELGDRPISQEIRDNAQIPNKGAQQYICTILLVQDGSVLGGGFVGLYHKKCVIVKSIGLIYLVIARERRWNYEPTHPSRHAHHLSQCIPYTPYPQSGKHTADAMLPSYNSPSKTSFLYVETRRAPRVCQKCVRQAVKRGRHAS